MTIESLQALLKDVTVETIDDPGVIDEICGILSSCWDDFQGSNETSMAAWKLKRMKKVVWQPPLLMFSIERHGATVLGSQSAEIQRWQINLETREATQSPAGTRRVEKFQPRLNVEKPVQDLVCVINSREDDPRLKWSDDKNSVRVLIGKVIPNDGPKLTVEGRRKRFAEALRTALLHDGWIKGTGHHKYVRK